MEKKMTLGVGRNAAGAPVLFQLPPGTAPGVTARLADGRLLQAVETVHLDSGGLVYSRLAEAMPIYTVVEVLRPVWRRRHGGA